MIHSAEKPRMRDLVREAEERSHEKGVLELRLELTG